MRQAIWQGDKLKGLRGQICGGLIKHGVMKLSQYGVAIYHSFAGCEAFPRGIPYPGHSASSGSLQVCGFSSPATSCLLSTFKIPFGPLLSHTVKRAIEL